MSNLDAALALAEQGWAVLPLGRSKLPLIRKSDECRATGCRGGCGRDGHGWKDATRDADTLRRWWTAHPDALIGCAVPDALVVVDVDPRHGGDRRLAALEAAHGPLPTTLTVWSGREDGGRHLYWRRPGVKVSEAGMRTELRRLGALGDEPEMGLDLKAKGGYCVMPPSLHPVTGKPYRWERHEIARPPEWLARLLVVPERPAATVVRREPAASIWDQLGVLLGGRRVADEYNARTRWADLLEGWECLDRDGDAEGARWRHPRATSSCSATVFKGCLYVYSTNTVFKQTKSAEPHGYSKFQALAELRYGGDMRAAANAIRAGAA